MNKYEIEKIREEIRIYSQKFVLPFYLKDDLGNLLFSATLTLVEYENRFFALTASHAIPEKYNLNRGVYVVGMTGAVNILGLTVVHRFDDIDLIVLDFHTKHFSEDRYYFDLNIDYPVDIFDESRFLWSGFPAKKAKNIYKKDPQVLVFESMNGNLMTHTKSLLAAIPFKGNYIFNNMDEYYFGYSDLKNASYGREGVKSKGYSYQGMSGGSLCLLKGEVFYPIQNDLFYFIGIGIEHKKDNTIVGIGKKMIVEKLKEIIKTPVEFSFVLVEDLMSNE